MRAQTILNFNPATIANPGSLQARLKHARLTGDEKEKFADIPGQDDLETMIETWLDFTRWQPFSAYVSQPSSSFEDRLDIRAGWSSPDYWWNCSATW